MKDRSKTPITKTDASLENERDQAMERAAKRDKFNKCFKMEQLDGNYEGEMGKNYKKEGNGVMMFDDGLFYIGQFKNDMFHGQALMVMPYGSVFFGHFEKNIIQGPGVLYLHRIRLIICRWIDNQLNGICFELHFPSRRWLTSQYANGTFLRYVSEYHLKEETSEIQDHPKELLSEHDLYHVYTRFKEKNFLFMFREEEILNSDPTDKHIEIVEFYDQRWFLGICKDGKPNGQGITFKDWQVCTIGTHLGEDLNYLVVDYTDMASIFHSLYVNGFHAEPIFYIALDKSKHIRWYTFSQVSKKQNVASINDLLKFKTEVHKKSPYYYHKIHLHSNSKEFHKLYELDESFYKSMLNRRIPEINSYIYLNLHVANDTRREERPINAFHLENLLAVEKDGWIQRPQTINITQHPKHMEEYKAPKSRMEKIQVNFKFKFEAVYEPIVQLIRRSMLSTQKEIDHYKELSKRMVRDPQQHNKLPIFQQLEHSRYEVNAKSKARIFAPQRQQLSKSVIVLPRNKRT